MQGGLVMAKSGRLELGDKIFYGHYRSTFNHCDVIGQQSYRIRWKTQNKGYYAVRGHSRSSRSVSIEARMDFLLVINTNWHLISYRYGVIAAYCSNFGHHFAFLSHPLGRELMGNVRCSSWAHWKARSRLRIRPRVKWTFLLDDTAEALRANIDWKSAILLQRGPVDPKFQVEGLAPTNHFSYQKSRLNDLSYDIKIRTYLFSVLSQCTRLTDWRTDRTVRKTFFSSLVRAGILCNAEKNVGKCRRPVVIYCCTAIFRCHWPDRLCTKE